MMQQQEPLPCAENEKHLDTAAAAAPSAGREDGGDAARLRFLDEVIRQPLSKHFAGLDVFPLLVMQMGEGEEDVLGRCEIFSSGFLPGGKGPRDLVARENTVKSVQLVARDENGPLPLVVMAFVLLHELAHCLTPVELRAAGRRKSRTYNDHSDVFYGNFSELLRKAVDLGLLRLTALPHMYTRKHLQRLDQLNYLDLVHAVSLTPAVVALLQQQHHQQQAHEPL
jgi:hypothetical protein